MVTSSPGIEVAGGKHHFGFTESEPAKSLSEIKQNAEIPKICKKNEGECQ